MKKIIFIFLFVFSGFAFSEDLFLCRSSGGSNSCSQQRFQSTIISCYQNAMPSATNFSWSGLTLSYTFLGVNDSVVHYVCTNPNPTPTPNCTSGYVFNTYTGQCQKPCEAAGDANPDLYGKSTIISGVSSPDGLTGSVCMPNSCAYNNIQQSVTCFSYGSSSGCLVRVGSSTGQMCGLSRALPPGEQSHDPKNPNSPTDCVEAGMVAGEVNGRPHCYKPAGMTSTTATTTKTDSTTTPTNASGTATGEATGETKEETKFVTMGSDGNATTTTNTKTCERDISGFVTCKENKTTTTQSKDDYCKNNPKDMRCTQGGTFGGSCGSGFTCSGDAVQCAIAKENYMTRCDLFENKTPLSEKGVQFANGTDSDAAGMPWHESKVDTVDLSGKAFDESRSLSGQCVRSVNVDVMGKQLTFDLSPFCDIMGKLSYLVVALAMLAGARIIAGVNK